MIAYFDVWLDFYTQTLILAYSEDNYIIYWKIYKKLYNTVSK